MTAILAIDTSSSATGVALAVNGAVVASSTVIKAYRHSENLFSRVDEVLAKGEVAREGLAAIAVTVGPGSFTGLRVGIATAKGLAFGLDIPIVGVSSLRALAAPHIGFHGVVAPAVDAKKSQIYASAYYADGKEALPERAWEPLEFAKALAALGQNCLVVGSGGEVYRDAFLSALGQNANFGGESSREIDPSHVALLGSKEFELGHTSTAAALAPSYLRRSEAEEKSENPA